LTPKISIVMPLFNKRAYVGDSIASVARQSFSDFELIVVDDGSTDGSASIVSSTGLPRLKLMTQANAGVSAARNRGLAAASSQLVAFLDADDVWRPDHLKCLWELSVAYPDACLVANAFLEVDQVMQDHLRSTHVSYRRVEDFIAEAASGRFWVFTSAAMVRRDACLSIGGFRLGESRGEDIDLWIRMALSFPVAMSDYVGCLYRRVDDSLTTSLSVLEPDVAMRGIVAALNRGKDLSPERKKNLKELYNRIAISNATDCLSKGQMAAARRFVELASDTRLYRRRRQLIWLLSLLPASFAVELVKMRKWAKAKVR
jgi:glycosyltransferase involved in cell wall biosynthesis